MNELIKAVKNFREAIERTSKIKLPVGLQNFPQAACGDTTLLLGHYLEAQGFGKFSYVSGTFEVDGECFTHAWIQQGEITIDITADQFQGNPPVIVSDASPWHEKLSAEVQGEANFTSYNTHPGADLSGAYEEIVMNLKRGAVED